MDQAGGKTQTLMKDALREYIRERGFQAVVRAAVREEVRAAKGSLTRTG